MQKVVVYGTLKKGGGLDQHLREATFLGNFTTKPEFTMVNLGWYPGVIHSGTTPIVGEVYEISDETFKMLDRVEGYPTLYTREEIETPYGVAWMYIYNVHKIDSAFNVVTDGNWNIVREAR